MDARKAALSQARLDVPAYIHDVPSVTEEDTTRANAVAASLTAALVLAALMLLKRGDDDAFTKAVALNDYRLRRIATTEVAQAFGRAGADVMLPEGWERYWDATLDSHTCKECRGLDGKPESQWPEGVTPGDIHVGCRCVTDYRHVS